MPTANPIEKRLQLAAEGWESILAHPDARLARLLGTPDDRQLFEGFLTFESDENGQLPDLFLRFGDEFTGIDAYVIALQKALKVQVEDFAAEAKESGESLPEGAPEAWAPPPPAPGGDPIDFWMATLVDFMRKYGSFFESVGIYLEPAGVGSAHEWMKFLLAVAKHADHPANARHLVWDDHANPQLEPLCRAEKVRVMTQPMDLDMPGAMNEVAAEADDGSAGATYRRHFTALATSGGQGDLPAAKAHSEKALAIASQEKWPALEVAAHMALAATLLGAKEFAQAYETYGAAEKSAQTAIAAQDPSGAKLELQAVAGKASTRVSAGDFQGAGVDYEIMAHKAEAQNDDRMALEGWRMAGYCREALKDWDGAYERNGKAIKVAEKMKMEDRETSTLPYVGQAFTRITQHTRQNQASQVKAYIDKLLPGWEKKVQRRAEAV